MAESEANATLSSLALKIIAPLIVSTICATAVILWTFSPSIAQNTRSIEDMDSKIVKAQMEAKEANERQIQIRLKLSQMDSKLDTVINLLKRSSRNE